MRNTTYIEWICLACQQMWLMPMKEVEEGKYQRPKAQCCPYCGVKFESSKVEEAKA